MSHHGFSDWFNYQASLKILVFAMLAGAALPGLFAVGLRLHAVGSGFVPAADGSARERNPVQVGIAWIIYAVVVAAIIVRSAVHRPRLHRPPHALPLPGSQGHVASTACRSTELPNPPLGGRAK